MRVQKETHGWNRLQQQQEQSSSSSSGSSTR
jgi:hypothetical protein